MSQAGTAIELTPSPGNQQEVGSLTPRSESYQPILEKWKRLLHHGKFAVTSLLLFSVGGVIGYFVGKQGSPIEALSDNPTLNYESETSQILSALEAHPLSAKMVRDYLDIRTTYYNLPSMRLTVDGLRFGTLPTPESLTAAAHKYLVDGLRLAQISLPTAEASKIHYDSNQDKATILDRTFDLNKPFQFQLLSAIIDLKLQIQSNNSPVDSTQTSYEKAEQNRSRNVKNERGIQHLLWLYDHSTPFITMDKDSFLFMPPKDLVFLSQTLQALQKAGLPLPKLTYGRPAPGVDYLGWYADGQAGIHNISKGDTATHEIFHSVADANRFYPENQKLQNISQETFNSLVMNIAGDANLTKYIAGIDEETGQPSLVEEYADRGVGYRTQGDSFRSRIVSLEKGDPIAYQLAKAQYEFYKNMFAGQEFTNEGELVETGNRVDQIYTAGTRVAVLDKDIQNSGILLRKTPTDVLDQSLPVIYNGADAEIIEGPVEVTDLYFNKTTFYKVKVIYTGSDSNRGLNKIGWIPAAYLGNVLPLPSTS